MTVWDLRKGDLFDPRLLVWIEDVETLKRLRSDIRAAEYIAFDVETTGLYEHAVTGGRVNDGIAARVVMATFTLVPHSGEDVGEPTTYVLPLSHPDSVWVGKWRKVLTIVAGWLKGKNLWAHHGKFDSRYIYAATGVDLADSLDWDSMASCVLLDENDVAKLKPRAAKLFEVEEWYDAPLNKPGAAEHVPYYNLGLYACIAEDQPVLTRRGSVPIQEVRLDDLVWDGVEWVRHDGVIHKGMQSVVTLDNGLQLTPDHLVLTTEGDYACAASILEGNRRAVDLSHEAATGGLLDPDRENVARATPPNDRNAMRAVREGIREAGQRLATRWPSAYGVPLPGRGEVWPGPSGNGAEVPLSRDSATMHSGRGDQSGARGSRDRVSVLQRGGVHTMDAGESSASDLYRDNYRQGGQLGALRAGESTSGLVQGAGREPSERRTCAVHGDHGCPTSPMASREDGRPGLPPESGRFGSSVAEGDERGAGIGWTVQTKPVYDILNAGPRYRFAVSGVIVSNCRDTYWTYRLTRAHRYLMWVDGRAEDESPLDEGDPDELLLARLGELAVHVAMPTVRTLARLEQRGIGLDRESTQKRLDEALAESERLKSALVSAYADVEGLEPEKASFAPTSKWFTAFTAEAVKRGDLEVVSMTAAGKPQWNKKVLNKLERKGNSLAGTMLEQRVHEKQAQFLESWLDKVTPSGEIHSTYNTDRVVTGRLSCVSPDTLIDMPRDMSKYPDGVPIKDVKEGDFVYSFDHHMRLTLRRVSWVGPTKTAPTIIVTFQNSVGDTRQLTCTPDHLIRLYSGDYRHAGYLMRNGRTPRVLGMVRRGYRDASQRDAYVKFFPNSNARQDKYLWGEEDLPPERDGGRAMEHRWVVEQVNYALHGVPLERRWDVNHIDGNKVNNHPSNLEYMPGWLHRRQTHFDGTRGKEQPGTTAYSGPTDWRPVDIQEGPIMEVWDMTVPFDHCFVANGIVVHNSSNPNMQQVARELKPAFVPRPGYVMMEADYSQIELRVAAMVSGCSPMIEAFQRGDDLHRLFGARLANRDRLEDVTAEERQKAKSANFGLLYGMGAEGFQAYAEDAYGVEMSLEEAFQVHRAFFEMWPGLTDWHAAQRNFAFRHGYVISPIGRVRRLPKIWSSNRQLAGEAERQAINAPVQGLGSDIMQIAASSIEGTLAGHSAVKGANIVATVHDSIEVELQEDRWEEVARECLDRMTEGVIPVLERLGMEVTVPLAAEAAVGYTWGDHSIGQFMSG